MLKNQELKSVSEKLLDRSLVSSILFIILLFSTFSSGFEVSEEITRINPNREEITFINVTKHPEPRPPKPEEPSIGLGDIPDEPVEPEPVDYKTEKNVELPKIDISKSEGGEDVEDFWGVNIKPKINFRVALVYPEIAKKMNLEGDVFLKYILNKEGVPTLIEVVSGHVILNEAAIHALKKFRFEPAIQNGKEVNVRMSQHFKFRLK